MNISALFKKALGLSFVICITTSLAFGQEASQDSTLYNGVKMHKNDVKSQEKLKKEKESASTREAESTSTMTMTTTSTTTSTNGTHWDGEISTTSAISRSGSVNMNGQAKVGTNFYIKNDIMASGSYYSVAGSRVHHNGYSVYYDAVMPNWSNGHVFRVAVAGAIDERLRIFGDGIETIRANFGIRVKPNSSYALDVNGVSHFNNNVIIDKDVQAVGSVSIGTTKTSDASGEFKLSVNGRIRASEVKVYTNWADFVFEPTYRLRPLKEVESYIKEKGHLPEMPTAKEVETNGVNIGETQSKLLQKIEELTLYLIEQNKKLDEQAIKLEEQSKKIKALEAK
jgi:hypothetical protein